MLTRIAAAIGSAPLGLFLMLAATSPTSAMPHGDLSAAAKASDAGVAPETTYYYYRRYYRYYYRPRYYGYRYYYRPRYRHYHYYY